MNLIFKNVTTYTKEEFLTFEKFHINRVNKVSFIIYTVACIIILLSAIGLIYLGDNSGYIFLIVGIFFTVYRMSIPYWYTKRILKSDKLTENLENTFELFDDNLKVTNSVSASDIRYDQLFKVYESKNCFYLYINKLQVFILNKNNFSVGNSDEFSKFIEEKLGKNFKKIL